MLLRDTALRLLTLCIGALILGHASPANAAERPLSRADVMKLAQNHAVLCEGWRDLDESCQSLLFLDMGVTGDITEVDRMQLAREPDVAVGIKNPVTLNLSLIHI